MASLLLLLLIFSSHAVGYDHDIHVSVGEVQVTKDGIELVVKTYLDDIQKAMGLEAGAELPAHYTNAQDMIADYIHSKVSITSDGLQVAFVMDEVAASMDAVWITLKTKDKLITQPKQLTINYSLLTELYKDQTNVINVKWPTGKDSALLNLKKTALTVNLK
jgi:hypothetical protein